MTSLPAAAAVTHAWSCVLFDLDGTIVDSAPGIIARLSDTLRELGRPVPDATTMLGYVGPPLLEGFRDMAGMTDAESREALVVYRRRVAEVGAEHDSVIYPGVTGVLQDIHAAGIPLALATSKPESQANRILEHYKISGLFTVICGASEDEVRSAKADVVAEALRRLINKGIDVSRTVMVGDRHHDVTGAGAHNIPTVLVEWGYGSPAEANGAIAVARSAEQLRETLLGA